CGPDGHRGGADDCRDRGVRGHGRGDRARARRARRNVGLRRGARTGTGPARAVGEGPRADAAAARVPRRRDHRPRGRPRADARRRIRRPRERVMRAARLLAVGWLLHIKMLSRSSFNGVLGLVYPLFFATVAFFLFREGSPHALLYASLGASVMGIWSSTSTAAGSALQRKRRHGTLELLVAAPTHFSLVI